MLQLPACSVWLESFLPGKLSWLPLCVSLLTKADEVHYYKYLAAVIEDVPLVSPEWQPHLLAAAGLLHERHERSGTRHREART